MWDSVPRVCGGGVGCAGGGVPLGAVPALSWCGAVSLGSKHIIITAGDPHRLIHRRFIYKGVRVYPRN